MINSGNRYVNFLDFEVTWMDEGLAHFAEDAVGRVETGIGDLEKITTTRVNTSNMSQSDYDAFFVQNFVRAKDFISRPDTTGPIVSDARAGANLASRGAAWLLLRYGADWFSSDNPRALTRKLAAGPEIGVDNLVAQTGAPLDTILAHWLVTLYTDNRSISGLPAAYNYKSYQMREILTALSGSGVPSGYLPVTTLTEGGSISADMPSGSAAYFLVGPSTGARTIQITNGPAPSGSADATLSNLGTMSVGNVRVLTLGQAQDGLTIPSGSASASYIVVLANASGDTTDAIAEYTVSGDGMAPLSATRSVSANVLPPLRAAQYTDIGGSRGSRVESTIRNYERSALRHSDPKAATTVQPPVRRVVSPGVPGDAIRVYVVRTQ